jgi:transposase
VKTRAKPSEVSIMFHIGIDISKFKHDCFIATDAGVKVKAFAFMNDYEGFQRLKHELIALGDQNQIKIGFESTGHYGINLKSFLSKLGYTYLEFNPQLTSQFSKATTLRRTKTDKIDAKLIATMLGQFDYKTLHSKFYHKNELKELVRQRDYYLDMRSKQVVRLTNVLDKSFPEFKGFFVHLMGKTPLYILKTFKNKEKISHLNKTHYETLRRMSKGRLTYPKFSKLKALAQTSIGQSNKTYDLLIVTIINHYHQLVKVIETLDKAIEDLYLKTDSLIHTLPSIGIITAATIYAEIDDIHRFSNPGQLTAYAGLDVKISQSGTTERLGKIVKRGSSLLRKCLYMYAFYALRYIPQLNDYYYLKKSQGKHHKVILVNISRKIIRIIFYIETHKVPFDINKVI